MFGDRPVADHLRDTDDQGPAADVHKVAQRTGRTEDLRREATGLRGGAPPRHDSDGYAGRLNDSAPAGSAHGGTGRDVPLLQQSPPLRTGTPAAPVRLASPYAQTLIDELRARMRRARGRGR
jgi:hypothetical protein